MYTCTANIERCPAATKAITTAIAPGTIQWETAQSDFTAEAIVWATGATKAHSSFLPPHWLNEDGFVKTDSYFRVEGEESISAIGDIAASDPHRSSARNWGYRIAANNITAHLNKQRDNFKSYEAPDHRWGSVMGVEQDGLRVYQPDGGHIRFPKWSINTLLYPLAVKRMIYKGIRKA